MNRDEIWRAIDEQRSSLADLLEDFSDSEWEVSSLCAGWRVRDVAAHVTLSHISPLATTIGLVRARGNLPRMIHDSAVRQAELPVTEYPALLRRMVGSRKKVPGIQDVEPLIDVLVHAQDMTIPLGRLRSMPQEATAVAATRVWSMGWPFKAQANLRGFELIATDHPWAVGHGLAVEGTMGALLLLITGRTVVVPQLSGPGLSELQAAVRR